MPTPRRLPGRTTRGTPTDCTSTLTVSTRAPTGITATPAVSTDTGITDSAKGTLPTATGTKAPVTAGRLPDRASSPNGTVTGPVPGTFIRSIVRAPTTVTDPDPGLPAAC